MTRSEGAWGREVHFPSVARSLAAWSGLPGTGDGFWQRNDDAQAPCAYAPERASAGYLGRYRYELGTSNWGKQLRSPRTTASKRPRGTGGVQTSEHHLDGLKEVSASRTSLKKGRPARGLFQGSRLLWIVPLNNPHLFALPAYGPSCCRLPNRNDQR